MIPILIQARLGSQRLPCKVLYPVKGKPLIRYMYERLLNCINAASIHFIVPKCDEEVISAAGVPTWGYDGDSCDVYGRYVEAIKHLRLHVYAAVVRLCADSPLIDPSIVDMAIKKFENNKAEFDSYNTVLKFFNLVTNTKPRTWPAGQCVEVISQSMFYYLDKSKPMSIADLEHVTPRMYSDRPEQIVNFKNSGKNYSHESNRMTVDTLEDYLRIKGIIENMTRDHTEYGWKECLALLS